MLSPGITPSYTIAPRIFKYGKGIKLYDIDGNEYFDFCSGVLTNSTGNCLPKIVKFMQKRLEELWNIYDYGTIYRLPLLEQISKMLPNHIDTFEFYSTGAEAIETGLRALYSLMPKIKKFVL